MFLRVLGRTRSAPTFPWAMSPRCHPRFHLRILSECPVLPLKDRPTPRGPKPTKPRTDPAQKLENPSSQNSKIMKGISRNRRHLEWSVSVFCNFLFRFVSFMWSLLVMWRLALTTCADHRGDRSYQARISFRGFATMTQYVKLVWCFPPAAVKMSKKVIQRCYSTTLLCLGLSSIKLTNMANVWWLLYKHTMCPASNQWRKESVCRAAPPMVSRSWRENSKTWLRQLDARHHGQIIFWWRHTYFYVFLHAYFARLKMMIWWVVM